MSPKNDTDNEIEIYSDLGLAKSFTRDLELALPICKFDEEKQTVTGWAALATDDMGKQVVDFQDEHVPVSELEIVAHDLVANGGAGMAGEMHDRRVGDIVESMVVDKAKREALGFGAAKSGQPSEGWAVTMRLDNDAWGNFKAGKRPEMSMHGRASMTPIGKRNGRIVYERSNLDVDEISIVDRGASGNDRVQPRIVLAKRATTQETPMTVAKKAELKKALDTLISSGMSKGGVESMIEMREDLSDEQKQWVMSLMEIVKDMPAKPADAAPAPAADPSPADAQAVLDGDMAKAADADAEAKKKADEEAAAKKKKEEEEKAKADAAAKADGPVAKALAGMDPDVRATMEKALAEKADTEERASMQKSHDEEKAELSKKVDTLVDLTKKMEIDAVKVEMTKRADARPYVPNFTTEQQVEMLIKAKDMGPEEFTRVDKMFDSINTASEESPALKQLGTDQAGESDSPKAKLDAMAKKLLEEMKKNKGGKRPTIQMALAKVYEDNPGLYAEMTAN